MNRRGAAQCADDGQPRPQTIGDGVRAQDQHQPGGTVLAGTAGDRAERGITTSALLNSIASKRGEGNLSSAVRVFVLEHFRAACQKETKA